MVVMTQEQLTIARLQFGFITATDVDDNGWMRPECERDGERDAILVTDKKCQLLAMSSSFLLNSKIPLFSLMPFSIFGVSEIFQEYLHFPSIGSI